MMECPEIEGGGSRYCKYMMRDREIIKGLRQELRQELLAKREAEAKLETSEKCRTDISIKLSNRIEALKRELQQANTTAKKYRKALQRIIDIITKALDPEG